MKARVILYTPTDNPELRSSFGVTFTGDGAKVTFLVPNWTGDNRWGRPEASRALDRIEEYGVNRRNVRFQHEVN